MYETRAADRPSVDPYLTIREKNKKYKYFQWLWIHDHDQKLSSTIHGKEYLLDKMLDEYVYEELSGRNGAQ